MPVVRWRAGWGVNLLLTPHTLFGVLRPANWRLTTLTRLNHVLVLLRITGFPLFLLLPRLRLLISSLVLSYSLVLGLFLLSMLLLLLLVGSRVRELLRGWRKVDCWGVLTRVQIKSYLIRFSYGRVARELRNSLWILILCVRPQEATCVERGWALGLVVKIPRLQIVRRLLLLMPRGTIQCLSVGIREFLRRSRLLPLLLVRCGLVALAV